MVLACSVSGKISQMKAGNVGFQSLVRTDWGVWGDLDARGFSVSQRGEVMSLTCVRGERSPEPVFCFLGAFGRRHVLSFGKMFFSILCLTPRWFDWRTWELTHNRSLWSLCGMRRSYGQRVLTWRDRPHAESGRSEVSVFHGLREI